MKSKIHITLEEDQPIIRATWLPSEDLRDKMLSAFIRQFSGKETGECIVKFHGGGIFDIIPVRKDEIDT